MLLRFHGHASARAPCVPFLACLRVSPNFSYYTTKLHKPDAARKAVIGLLTTSLPESHFRFHVL